jgi:hypothetical protein
VVVLSIDQHSAGRREGGFRIRHRIPRSIAHLQIIKHRQGKHLQSIVIRYTHGSQKCIEQALHQLGYHVPNTSAIERRNGTTRLMSKAQVRKSLAFSKREDQKTALGWWALTAYNSRRPHRSLRCPPPQSQGKKTSTTFSSHGVWPGKFNSFASTE